MSDIPEIETVTRRLLIEGRVQGVGYRNAACRQAQRLGLSGWVRNRVNGDVEILARGPMEALFQFIEWCNGGPPAARVNHVDATPAELPDDNGQFEIHPTA